MEKYKLYFLVLVTVVLGFSAVYMGYLVYVETQSAPKVAGEMKIADQPQLTESQSEEDAPIEARKIVDAGIGFVELTIDKKTYTSYEDIEMTVLLESEDNFNNAEIRIIGIKPYQVAYINKSEFVDLQEGENTFTFNDQTPSCTSGCGGVFPGPYDIEAEVYFGENLVGRAVTTINLSEN